MIKRLIGLALLAVLIGYVVNQYKPVIDKDQILKDLVLSVDAPKTPDVAKPKVDLPNRSYQYRALVIKEARMYWGPNANVALFAAQFHQESMWNNNAKSHVGAQGLGQFMPATAKDVHARYADLRQYAMYSENWSVKALFLYDRELYRAIKPLRKTSIHPCSHYAMMLSSYNGGLGWLNRDRKLTITNGKNPDIWWDNVEKYSNRAGWAIRENRDYPIKIMLRHLPMYLAAGYPGDNPCQV